MRGIQLIKIGDLSFSTPNTSLFVFDCLFVSWWGCLFVGVLVGWLVCWLVGVLVGWLVNWLVGWLVGWFRIFTFKLEQNRLVFEI